MGCEFTIFEGDTRAYTTVIQDGQRAVGTKLSASLSTTVLQQGQSYVGKAKILNEEYLCSYVPTLWAKSPTSSLEWTLMLISWPLAKPKSPFSSRLAT